MSSEAAFVMRAGLSMGEVEQPSPSTGYMPRCSKEQGGEYIQYIKAVSIPKKDGSKRVLGLPTLLDRIAQQVIKVHFEKYLEPHFHQNSYGYRKGKSMLNGIAPG